MDWSGLWRSRMGKIADEEHAYLMVLRVTMIAF
jgi:hypothetical protein